MTPDLERAAMIETVRLALSEAASTINAKMDLTDIQTIPYAMEEMNFLASSAIDAALRALRDPSPAIVEVMTRRLHEVNQSLGLWDEPLTRSRCREMALATWQAGIDAILESEP